MRPLRLEKPGIRCLGIAESFLPESETSTLAGVIMRNDMVVDGFVFGSTTVSGEDATDAILQMYRSAGRQDIGYLLLWGTVISHYNMVDVATMASSLNIPVIGLSGKATGDLPGSISGLFPDRVERYRSLVERHPIEMCTGHTIYARVSGCTMVQATRLLNAITVQGSVPEPVRLARLLAAAARRWGY